MLLHVDAGAEQPATYVIETTVAQPIDVVWAAVTKKNIVDRYYFIPLGADIDRAGQDIFFGNSKQKLITGTVTQLTSPTLLRHTFRFTDEADKTETTVTYRLSSEASGTRLRIEQSGYRKDLQGYGDIAGGWPIIVDRMKAVLAGEKPRT